MHDMRRWLIGALVLAGCGEANVSSPPDGKDAALTSGPGDFAAAFLRGDTYRSLRVVIQHVDGHSPPQVVQDTLRDTAKALLSKSGGVTIAPLRGLPVGANGVKTGGAYSIEEVRAIEEAVRSDYRSEDTGEAILHVLYLNGHFDEDTASAKVLAAAYRGASVVVFKETIASTCNAPLPAICDVSEATVVKHELGHILGLVNLGTPMVVDHHDEANGAHDDDSDCVMYWAHKGIGLFDVIRARRMGGALDALPFDQHCLDDLAAVRGGT